MMSGTGRWVGAVACCRSSRVTTESLRVVKGTAQHFYNRGADTFPIAYKLYHPDVEHEGIHLGCVFGEVKETARRDESGGRENNVRTDTERKNDVQSVGLHIVSVAIIDT